MLDGNKVRQMMPNHTGVQAAYLMDDGVTIERWPVDGIVLVEDEAGDLMIRYFAIDFDGLADFPDESGNFIGYVSPNQLLTPEDDSVKYTLRRMRARDAKIKKPSANKTDATTQANA